MTNLFAFDSFASALPLLFLVVLLAILVISFRSRAVVFCQYLEAMTGIKLSPADVRARFRERGRNGVREMFLELLIRGGSEGRADCHSGRSARPADLKASQNAEVRSEKRSTPVSWLRFRLSLFSVF